MPTPLSCRLMLLVTMVPLVGVAGRLIPAPPITASLTPTPQVEISAHEMKFGAGVSNSKRHDQQRNYVYNQDSDDQEYFISRPPPPSRKLVRGSVKLDDTIFGHRLLVGSAPPSCQGKCGSCVPCTPIHVSIGSSPVHSGSVTQQEYYPEVWRCKCGNKTFMP